MAHYGHTSEARLNTVHPALQELFRHVIEKYDNAIIYGMRTETAQRKLVDEGLSKTMNSKHLPQRDGFAHAVDVAPYPIDWENTKQFYHFAGYVQGIADRLGIEIRWGGDWDSDFDLDDQTFMDLVHFELVEEAL